MAEVFVSDFTKRTLAQFGWKEGDLIPDDVGPALLAAKDKTKPTNRTDIMIDIADMRQEDIDAVQEILNRGRKKGEQQKKEAELNEQLKFMSPEVAIAYKQMLAQVADQQNQSEEEGGVSVVDDREAQDAEPQPAAPAEPVEEEKPSEPPAAPEVKPEPPPEPVNEPLPAPVILPFCPRCGWDMRMKFDIEITDRDKEDFIAILLGNARFKKRYSLLNDKFIVTFRSLLADENTIIQRQLALDAEAKEFVTQDELFLRLFEYRLACSLESVYDGTGRPLAVLPPLAEVDHKPPPERPLETPAVYVREYINKTVLAHEVTRRLVGNKLREFQRLIEALEAMALDPSFWEGIG